MFCKITTITTIKKIGIPKINNKKTDMDVALLKIQWHEQRSSYCLAGISYLRIRNHTHLYLITCTNRSKTNTGRKHIFRLADDLFLCYDNEAFINKPCRTVLELAWLQKYLTRINHIVQFSSKECRVSSI